MVVRALGAVVAWEAGGLLFVTLKGRKYFSSSLDPRKLLLQPGSMPQSILEDNNLARLL